MTKYTHSPRRRGGPWRTGRRAPAGESIRALWSAHFTDYSARSIAAFLAYYYAAAAWTSGLAIPAGTFSPTLLIGSCIGRLFAHTLRATGLVAAPDGPLYGLLGAAAFFTGQARVTVSLCVVLLEIVRSETALPFLMVRLLFPIPGAPGSRGRIACACV